MSEPQLVVIERAKSNRSKCITASIFTGETTYIELGELRIGVQAWLGGRTTTFWQKASSFLQWGCFLEYAKNGAATCKISKGEKMPKGTLRFAIRNGEKTQIYVKMDCAIPIVRDVLCAADAKPSDLQGFSELSATDRQMIMNACKISKAERIAWLKQHPHPMEGAAPKEAAPGKKRAATGDPEAHSSCRATTQRKRQTSAKEPRARQLKTKQHLKPANDEDENGEVVD